MPFPIVVGTKCVASRPLAMVEPVEEFANDGNQQQILIPDLSSLSSTPTIIVARSTDQRLMAVITVYYYNMVHEYTKEIEYCSAEIRIQIISADQSSSLNSRETLHRIQLPDTGGGDGRCCTTTGLEAHDDIAQDSAAMGVPRRMAVFSFDRRHLVCLLPHPTTITGGSTQSTVVVFQLRRPKITNTAKRLSRPPLPSYISTASSHSTETTTTDSLLFVATNPRVLSHPKNIATGLSDPLLSVTTITDVRLSITSAEKSVLMLGCADGRIWIASYRPLLLLGGCVLHPANDQPQDTTETSITALDHHIEPSSHVITTNDNLPVIGRLAVLFANGTISIFDSVLAEIDAPSTLHGSTITDPVVPINDKLAIRFTKTAYQIGRIDGSANSTSLSASLRFGRVKWISRRYLIALQRPSIGYETSTTVVFALSENDSRCFPVSTNTLSTSRLEEQSVTKFQSQSVSPCTCQQVNGDAHTMSNVDDVRCGDALLELEYDIYSDCIAISSFLSTTNHRYQMYPFVSLWSWKTNSLGFTAYTEIGSESSDSMCLSRLHFASDAANRRKLIHMTAHHSSMSHNPNRIRKETYDVAVLSPPSEIPLPGGNVREASSLMLNSSSVSYPIRLKTSIRDTFEVQWSESFISSPYIASYGSPLLACIGRRNCRSIAVASSRSLCILDGLGMEPLHRGHFVNSEESTGSKTQDRVKADMQSLRMGNTLPKWRLYGNEVDERSFRVVAMTWWEGAVPDPHERLVTLPTDDLLVAIIEHFDNQHESTFYLSCWSGRSFEHGRQLLCSPYANGSNGAKWGAPMPAGFVPARVDLLACPCSGKRTVGTSKDVDEQRKACVLVSDASDSTQYRIYQLQLVSISGADFVREHNRYNVFTRCSAVGAIGSSAELFLASSSFAFHLNDDMDESDSEVEHASVAVIGVVRTNEGGMDALCVHSSSIVAVGKVIESSASDEENPRDVEISRIWLSDVLLDRGLADGKSRTDFFVWVLQLASGRLLTWSVPCVRLIDGIYQMVEPIQTFADGGSNVGATAVHPKGLSLGIVCPAGTASGWMQQSSIGTRDDFLTGQVPKSDFGFVVGVSQQCRKLHRSSGQDFGKHLFRSDFFDHEILYPSDSILYPPSFLLATYALLLDTSSCGSSLDDFDRQITRNVETGTLQNETVMAVQLILMRLVEKIAAVSKHQSSKRNLQSSLLEAILASLLDSVRRSATPLQFASLLLSAARQLEPSCFHCLFPLASRLPGADGKTVDDLFMDALEHGSISIAVASLPMLVNSTSTEAMCTATFRYCLSQWDIDFCQIDSIDFGMSHEERTAMADIFRYGLKLVDRPEEDDVYASDNDLLPDRGYSIMCGISHMFSRRDNGMTARNGKSSVPPVLVRDELPKAQPNKQLRFWSIQKLSSWRGYVNYEFKTVASVTARFIVSTIFHNATPQSDPLCWQKVGALALCLLGDSKSDLYCCSPQAFSTYIKVTASNRYSALLPSDYHRSDGLVRFLDQSVLCCDQSLSESVVGSILDLMLILLGCETVDFQSDIPGLLLVAIVTANAAHRITEILPDDDATTTLWAKRSFTMSNGTH